MDWVDVLRWIHVLGATVLIGTGSGIAFFMVMAHRTQNAVLVAHTASVVVVADMIFTATAAVLQPITGLALAWELGWSLSDGWIAISLAIYIFIGLYWVPVLFIQIRIRDEAIAAAQEGIALTSRYARLYRIWFACGVPAFAAIVILLWLMLMKPSISF